MSYSFLVLLNLLALLLQGLAVVYALRLSRVTGRSLAWILISVGLGLMEIRRVFGFCRIIAAGQVRSFDFTETTIVLVISVTLLAGIYYIRPVFASLKAAKDALQKREAALELLFSKMANGFALHEIVRDQDGNPVDYRFLKINPAFEKLTGWKADAVVGRTLREVLPTTDDLCWETFGKVARSGEPISFEYHLASVGRYFSVTAYCSEPLRLGAVFNDITELKRSEEARRKFEAEMYHSQKLESLGVLAGGIAHDFSNLLVGVLGNVDLALAETPRSALIYPLLNDIVDAAKQAALLCKQLLAYSGKGRFVVERVDFAEMIREMRPMVDLVVSKNSVIHYDLAEQLPPVEADVSQLRQVVMNLLTNASESLPDGRGSIELRLAAAEPPASCSACAGPWVVLTVEDHGCGMTAEVRERMFEPFYSTKFTGRGLGMAAVAGIVRAHGGQIDVESERGRGTTVRIILPPAARVVSSEQRSQQDGVAQLQLSGTVLLVDDQETVRHTGEKLLEHLGLKAVTASSARSALEILHRDPGGFVCMILDLTMPEMGGLEALPEVRRIAPDLPVILSSGYNKRETAPATDDRSVHFLQKPYTIQNLENVFTTLSTPPEARGSALS